MPVATESAGPLYLSDVAGLADVRFGPGDGPDSIDRIADTTRDASHQIGAAPC